MEQGYTVGVHNKFAAFDEDIEDPYDIIKRSEAEKLKKKTLKVTISNDNNKENKSKDANEVKAKPVKKALGKPERTPAPPKPENNVERTERANNRRNKDDDFPRTGNFRDGKPEGGAPRGPRNDNREPRGDRGDGPRGDRREGDRRDGDRRDGDRREPREPRPFRGEGGDRGDRERRPPRGDGESRPYRPRGDGPANGENRPRRERREFGTGGDGSDFEGRSDGRGSGAPRGRGPRPPGRNFDNRGKREFDRHSGSDRTGVKSVDKRDGAGSFNWDSTKDAEALIPLNESNLSDEQEWGTPAVDTDGAPAPTENETGESDEVAAPVEEEPQELTLDEYRKLRGKREGPQYNIRKPGEGEDLSQWKNMIEMKKKDTEDEEEEFEIADCPQRAGRQKHVVGIDITFNDNMRGGRGRGRGGRGRDSRDNRDREPREDRREGREGRDGPPQRRFPPREREDRRDRGDDRNRPSAPKVDDEKAFPSLG